MGLTGPGAGADIAGDAGHGGRDFISPGPGKTIAGGQSGHSGFCYYQRIDNSYVLPGGSAHYTGKLSGFLQLADISAMPAVGGTTVYPLLVQKLSPNCSIPLKGAGK